ncbi:MAG TPA: phosphatase PAP2 family protein [Terriglobales bacterium]|nr:phosphatase PAP2 family protein [Terriglobales bacterium]
MMAILRLGLNDPEQTEKPVPLITAAVVSSLVAAVIFLALFSWIAEEMREGETAHFDAVVRNYVNGFASPGLTKVMFAITEMGGPGLIAMMVVGVSLFLYERWKRGMLWLTITMVGAAVLNLSLKNSFRRMRPEPFFGTVPSSYSFPSGHALFSFCFYLVMAGLINARIRSRWLRILIWSVAAVLVTLIGLSRIYLGVHFPSDVVGGYMAGAIWVTTMITADRIRKTRRGVKLATVSDPVEP